MPVTLLDELAIETNNMRKGILQTLVETVNLQDRFSWENTGALQLPVTYLSGIPTVPLRHINEVATPVSAQFAQLVEPLHIIDTDIDIDPVLVAIKNQVTSIEVAQTKAVVSAIGYRINDLFINGDPAVNAREPRGVKVRLRDDLRFTGMTVNATANAVALDFSPDGTDANKLMCLNKIDELLAMLEDKATILLVSRQFRLAFWSSLRQLKLLDVTKDQFEREILSYRGVPIVDPGFKPVAAIDGTADVTTADVNQIIGFDGDVYTAGGDPGVGNGANAYPLASTVYALRLGPEHVLSLQLEPMRVKAYGETDATPHMVRTNIRWVISPCAPLQKRSMARLVGVVVT